MDKKPISRQKHVTDNSKGVNRRGNGLGTGPVGNGGQRGTSRSSGGRRSPLLVIIAIIVALLGGGGAITSNMLGGDDSSYSGSTQDYSSNQNYSPNQDYAPNQDYTSNQNTAMDADLSVAEGSRSKYTKIIGNGEDEVTLMVYMCGTDLESKYGMATNDINEMLRSNIGDKVNIIIYTGGCKQWKNNTISNSTNQIYQIKNNRLVCLEDNLGSAAMTKPSTLTGFIEYCHGNFPANRYDLILWDHGGGSVSGYGYDEKYASAGGMSLSGIKTALSDANVDFDFIGFDACLMATLENGLMLSDYADYMIASEETEPGVGWYYTNWLTALGENTSIPTVELGSKIVDDFVDVCGRDARGQKTTLSVVDLAELSYTVPDKLRAFSANTSELIKNDQYAVIASARAATREFAVNSKIDQVDLIHLSENIGTNEGKELAEALKGAVKYNSSSSNMSNANGLSIYFPYRKLSYVDTAVLTYRQIGMDDEYSKCIKEYAGLETTGQSASYNSYGNSYGNPLYSLLGAGSSSNSSSDSYGLGSDALLQMMGSMFFSDRSLSEADSEAYVSAHSFDASALEWTDKGGQKVIELTDAQWDMITDVEINMFVDDGDGYIDMGLDNLFEIDDEGAMIPSVDNTWLAVNGQPVAYYHMTSDKTADGYSITGYVPAMLDGDRVNLILEFTQDNPYGEIVGVSRDYKDTDIQVQAKNLEQLEVGSTLEFLCDYYSYEGTYEDSFYLGEPMTVTDSMEISNVSVGDKDALITYCFTDIYNSRYWTPVLQ